MADTPVIELPHLTVNLEKILNLDMAKSPNEYLAYQILKQRGLGKLVSPRIPAYTASAAEEFMHNPTCDVTNGQAITRITYVANEQPETMELDVRQLLIETFNLPESGESILDIGEDLMNEMLDKALIDRQAVQPLLVANMHSHFKTLIHIIHHCILGLRGFFDQVSLGQHQFLTALITDQQWDWASALIQFLEQERKAAQGKLMPFAPASKYPP